MSQERKEEVDQEYKAQADKGKEVSDQTSVEPCLVTNSHVFEINVGWLSSPLNVDSLAIPPARVLNLLLLSEDMDHKKVVDLSWNRLMELSGNVHDITLLIVNDKSFPSEVLISVITRKFFFERLYFFL